MSDILTDTPPAGQVAVNQEPKQWYDGADPDTIGFIQNKKWDTPLKAIEGYRNLEKYVGVSPENILKIPAAEDKAAWDNVFTRLGRPESPDKYGRDNIKVPEGVTIDDTIVTRFDSLFHEVGLTKSQRDVILNKYLDFENEVTTQKTKEYSQTLAAQEMELKKEWGSKYDERVALARQAFRAFLPEGVDRDTVAETLERTLGVGVTAKLFANMADKMGEDKFHDEGNVTSNRFGYTKEQALNDRNELMRVIGSDPQRLREYSEGRGRDIEEIRRLNNLIAKA